MRSLPGQALHSITGFSWLIHTLYVSLTSAPSSHSMFNARQCRPISTANYVFEFYLEGYLIIIIMTIRHGPYHRTHHFIASFVESKPDNTELSHQYCADIGDGISTKYLVTTMIISHFNHLLWEVNRGNCRLQRAVYPCLFISNTQL